MFVSIAIVAMLFSACNKDITNDDNDYLSEIVGTYSGEFSNESGLKASSQGTADVVLVNEQLQIHCYGDLLDTTIIMDAFGNRDSIMICETGEAFERQYGHMGNGGNHMMHMDDDETEWEHHMNDDHENGDMHYGGFDMEHHTFGYKFRKMEGDSISFIMFNGSKN